MKILKHREYEGYTSYSLHFNRIACPGSGYAFDCDSEGNIDIQKLNPIAQESYAKALAGVKTGEFQAPQIMTFHNHYTSPAVGECNDCGRAVILSGFTNECECGLDYNMSGQELAPRSQWGEETGESLSDILRIP